jgi:hypothetical protein
MDSIAVDGIARYWPDHPALSHSQIIGDTLEVEFAMTPFWV